MKRKPEWLRVKVCAGKTFSETEKIVKAHSLHTICSSGMCPNKGECWSRGTATLMILGEICTRACKFCATLTGRPTQPDVDEPEKVAQTVSLMKLKHCVLTSVTRDDLPDGGAAHWKAVIDYCKKQNPSTTIEVLIPDFNADPLLIQQIVEAAPAIVSHNIETVRRLTPSVRSKATYETSLQTLRHLSASGILTKSSFMLGLGETQAEVEETLKDLYDAGCRIVSLGQYLQPTTNHLSVEEFVTPDMFSYYKEKAHSIGFKYAECGPLVRSSYMAENAIESCSKE